MAEESPGGDSVGRQDLVFNKLGFIPFVQDRIRGERGLLTAVADYQVGVACDGEELRVLGPAGGNRLNLAKLRNRLRPNPGLHRKRGHGGADDVRGELVVVGDPARTVGIVGQSVADVLGVVVVHVAVLGPDLNGGVLDDHQCRDTRRNERPLVAGIPVPCVRAVRVDDQRRRVRRGGLHEQIVQGKARGRFSGLDIQVQKGARVAIPGRSENHIEVQHTHDLLILRQNDLVDVLLAAQHPILLRVEPDEAEGGVKLVLGKHAGGFEHPGGTGGIVIATGALLLAGRVKMAAHDVDVLRGADAA